MELMPYFKSLLEQERAAVVICALDHEIIYMNPTAIQRYAKSGGAELIGKSVLACHAPESVEKINRVLEWFSKDRTNNIVFTYYNERENKDVYMIALRDEGGALIGYYEKYEYRNRETDGLYRLK